MEEDRLLTDEEVAVRRHRRLQMMALQELESNPLDADDIAMFEMFERERWSDARCRTYILSKVQRPLMAAE